VTCHARCHALQPQIPDILLSVFSVNGDLVPLPD
jgi:hypothetical protein